MLCVPSARRTAIPFTANSLVRVARLTISFAICRASRKAHTHTYTHATAKVMRREWLRVGARYANVAEAVNGIGMILEKAPLTCLTIRVFARFY